MELHVVQKVMKFNDELALTNRHRLNAAGLMAINIISAPGSGKTTLIEAALERLAGAVRIGVIEGDPDTQLDAERIAKHNVPVVQIETAGGCHLEAHLVGRALDRFKFESLDLIVIENVGNLVCPVEFNLGESYRVAVVSTAEGHDKPAKYPKLFRTADVVLLNKCDLLPYVDFDEATFRGYIEKLNPQLPIIKTSCRTGDGIDEWTQWLARHARQNVTC